MSARNAPSHTRVIISHHYIDEAYFFGGLDKDKVLNAYGAHIFFDDQETHLEKASKVVPSGKVPYASDSLLKKI